MLCAHLGDMACEEDESKAAPQRRAAPIGRLLTAADDLGSQAVATPANEVQIPYAGANRLLDLANGMVPTCAPLNSPCLSMGSCAVPLDVVGVDAMVARLRKAFFNAPTRECGAGQIDNRTGLRCRAHRAWLTLPRRSDLADW